LRTWEHVEAQCRRRITESGHLNPAGRRTESRARRWPLNTVSVPTCFITPKD